MTVYSSALVTLSRIFRWGLLYIVLIFSISIFFSFNEGWAAEEAIASQDKQQNQQKLKQLKQQIQKVKTRLNANKNRYNSAAQQLKTIEVKVAHTTGVLRQLQKKLKESKLEIDKLTRRETTLLKKKQQQQKVLSKQFRAAYGNGQEEYLKLLLNQDEPAELGRMLSYFKYLNAARSEEILKLSQTLQELSQLKLVIDKEHQNLVNLTQEQKNQVAQLSKQQSERKEIASHWQKKVRSADLQLNNLLADEKELQSIIEAVREIIEVFFPKESLIGLAKLKGKLRWPVVGKLINRYGSERYQGKMRWHGVMLKANEGRPVHAISTGQVVFSDWLRGYGLLTMVDHGKGYLSLYGHNQSLLKQVGDWVDPGEVIAYVGNTGGRATSSLYFEIRHHKKTVNPALWCK